MPLLNLPNELPSQNNIVVELVPQTCSRELATRKSRKGMEIQSINNNSYIIYYNRYDCASSQRSRGKQSHACSVLGASPGVGNLGSEEVEIREKNIRRRDAG